MVCAGFTYMLCVPQCGVSLTQTPFPPSAQFVEPWNILGWRDFKGYFVQIRMLNVILSTIEAFNCIMCGLEEEGHV